MTVARQKFPLLYRINLAIAFIVLGGILTLGIWGFITSRNNTFETKHLQDNVAAILSDRYRNGPSEQSADMRWPDEIYKSHPTATHVASVKVDQSFLYLKYLSFAIQDQQGWHFYTCQVEHYRQFSPLGGNTIEPTSELEKDKVGLLE